MQLRRNLLMQKTDDGNLFDKAYLSNPANYVYEYSYYFYTNPITLKPNTSYTITPSSTAKLNTNAYYVLSINATSTPGNLPGQGAVTAIYPVQAGTPKKLTFLTGETGEIRYAVYRISGATGQQALQEFMSIDWTLFED